MKIRLSITLWIILAMCQHTAIAGTVSDTFSTGDTLTADHLTNIKDAINDNDTRITNIRSINVYVDTVRKGALIDSIDNNFAPAHFASAEGFTVLLDTGYIAFVSTGGDGLMQFSLAYESIDCTGQPYDQAPSANLVLLNQGYVYANDSPSIGTAYYVPAGTAPETVNIQSYTKDNVCQSASTTWSGVKVYLNEPSITGITNTDFIGDIKVGF